MLGYVSRYLRKEEALEPGAIFAEIVHLPQERFGNFIYRPIFREHEIPYLGRSGGGKENQIPITDLMVSVRNGKVVLHSRRLGKRVIPRLTALHHFDHPRPPNLPIYRFLCALQNQDVRSGLGGRDLGALGRNLPFLPRLSSGRFILARAGWHLGENDIKQISFSSGKDLVQSIQRLRERKHLPRYVNLVEWDNELPIDLDNVLGMEVLAHVMKTRKRGIVLREMLPSPAHLCVSGPEGRFFHEIVLPIVRLREPSREAESRPIHLPANLKRSFSPGSEWLFVKLYGDSMAIDKILAEILPRMLEEITPAVHLDRWFFLRYGDPEPHLRLRFHGEPDLIRSNALRILQKHTTPLLKERLVWRVQIDTYHREIERYGGWDGVLIAEEIFHLDSEAVMKIVGKLLPGDEGEDARWRLAVAGIDMLLSDLGLDLPAKRDITREQALSFGKEFRVEKSKTLRKQLNEKLRSQKAGLQELLRGGLESNDPLWNGIKILRDRSRALDSAVKKLRNLEMEGTLLRPIRELAKSFAHMHVNRMLRTSPRAHEAVLCYFLAQVYEADYRLTLSRDS